MTASPKDLRLPLMVSREEAERIDAWWHEKRLRSRAEAVRALIALGFNASTMSEAEASPAIKAPKPKVKLPRLTVPYEADVISSLSPEHTEQLNTKITARLNANLTWMAAQLGKSKRDVVQQALGELAERTLQPLGMKPIL